MRFESEGVACFGISCNTRRCRFASPVVGAEAPLCRRVRRTQRRATLCSKTRPLIWHHRRGRFAESETTIARE